MTEILKHFMKCLITSFACDIYTNKTEDKFEGRWD